MEAALLHSSSNHHESMSPCKRVRNPKRNNQTGSLIPSRTNSNGNLYYSESLPKMEMMVNGGVFLNPPFPLSSSLPRLNSSPYPLQFHQPPLLPLPMASPSPSRQFRSLPTSVGNGTSPSHKKQNKGNKHQTNANPSKTTTSPQKVTYANNTRKYPATKSDVSRLGPDPESLPRDLTKVIMGSDFPQAPPPCSLPMPTFSLKPKLSCKVEATSAGDFGRVDTAGATNNLCRLLNLR